MYKLAKSITYCWAGLKYAFCSERNLRIHLFMSFLVLMLMILLPTTLFELIVVLFSIALVISAELLNTAIETVVNLVSPEYHPLAKIAKDVAASAVFVTCVGVFCIGFLIFFPKFIFLYYIIF